MTIWRESVSVPKSVTMPPAGGMSRRQMVLQGV
nr:MAG TPA: hypothetical protein [Caudoviricetes sp.]